MCDTVAVCLAVAEIMTGLVMSWRFFERPGRAEAFESNFTMNAHSVKNRKYRMAEGRDVIPPRSAPRLLPVRRASERE